MPEPTIDLSRAPRLARCPNGGCGSHDVKRTKRDGEGPQDECQRCGRRFAHVPGTITAMQLSEGKGDEPDADDQGGPPKLASRFGKSVMSA